MPKVRQHQKIPVTIDRAKIDKEKRAVELSFSSETPVARWGENEILSHREGDYDFSRVNSGNHPLLLGHAEHDPNSQIGVIESASVQDGKGRAIVRFGNSSKAQEIFQDVQDGIRKNISVGYDHIGIVDSNKASDGMVTTRYKWAPTHIAVVPVPADTKVGIGRDADEADGFGICMACGADTAEDAEKCHDCGMEIPERSHSQVDSRKKVNVESVVLRMSDEDKNNMRILLDAAPPAAAGGGTPASVADPLKRHKQTMREVRAIADQIVKDHPHTAEKIRENVAEIEGQDGEVCLETVRAKLYATALGVSKPAPVRSMASVGYSAKDIRGYSLMRGIRSCIQHDCHVPTEGLEREWHDGMSKELNGSIEVGGFLMPIDARTRGGNGATAIRDDGGNIVDVRGVDRMGRDLTVGTFNQGGAFVPTVLETPIIEVLRNKMVLTRRGIMTLAGLTSNITVPRQTAAATAYSLPEQGLVTVSNQAIDQIAMVPHRISYQGRYSRQLLIQSAVDVEGFLRDDAMKVLALKADFLGMFGGTNADEPTGIVNQPGISSITFGGAPTFAAMVNMETALAALNADIGKLAYVTSATSRGILKQTAKTLTGATTVVQIAIWDGQDNEGEGMINGYVAAASNQILNNIMIFADWSSVIMGLFGGFDVIVDPYTQAGAATNVITINTFIDYALRHAQSVCASTDSAAQ